MHKSFEHSNKGCVWNEDAPTVAFVRLFSAIGACGHLQPQALFVSLRTTRTERTQRNEEQRNKETQERL